MAKAHPGFKAVQASIAKKQGISSERAGAILAAGSRGASKAAKKANPRLKKVHGGNTLISADSMKGQSMCNKDCNHDHKMAFKQGKEY
jgi:hypothetical protein